MLFLRWSRPRFQGRKHINLYKLCYSTTLNADGSITLAGWPAFYTLAQLQGIKALGFDSVRLCFRGDPLVMAQSYGNTAQLDDLINGLIGFGQLCLQAGLLVNFDFHPTGAFSTKLLASSDATAPLFAAYMAAAVRLGVAITNTFLPEQATFDLFNEPNPPTAYWASTLQPAVFRAVRAACPQLTLLVRGEGDTLANLPNLRVADYDWNTLYSVHNYDFVYFTYAGSTEQGPVFGYLSQVDYPPDGLSSAAALARTTANINADASLTAAQKASYADTAQYYLYNYYTNLTRYGLLTNQLPGMTQWARANGIDSSQIYIGEMGAVQSSSPSSTTVAARAAWYADTTGWYTSQTIRWGVFCADMAPWLTNTATAAFYLQDPASGAGSVCSSANVPAAIKAALGLL